MKDFLEASTNISSTKISSRKIRPYLERTGTWMNMERFAPVFSNLEEVREEVSETQKKLSMALCESAGAEALTLRNEGFHKKKHEESLFVTQGAKGKRLPNVGR